MKILKIGFDLKDLSELETTGPQFYDWMVGHMPDDEDRGLNFEPIGGYSTGPGHHEGPGG